MPRFRKKPVEVEAVLWDGTNIEDVLALVEFDKLPNDVPYVKPGVVHVVPTGELEIPTLEGTMTASAGDWIIRGVEGEVYPVKPSIFDATYEAV